MPSLPASTPAPKAAPSAKPWARWFAPRAPSAVTAVMLGTPHLLVRVESAREPGGPMRLTAAQETAAGTLKTWKDNKLFAGSRALLVLGQEDRQLLAIERPEVPDAELNLAVRFPLAEALEQEPDQVLSTALTLPRISEGGRGQVLAVGGALGKIEAQLAQLAEAGIKPRSIDIIDSALRGMTLLQARAQPDAGDAPIGQVVLAFVGRSICIGLLWRGEFCALRSLPLPVREPRDAAEFEEHLALHIQRTTDQFERQATQIAVRQVLAAMPSLQAEMRESVRGSLPLDARLFDIGEVFDMPPPLRELLRQHNDLHALACVAAARLIDWSKPPETAVATAAEAAAPELVS